MTVTRRHFIALSVGAVGLLARPAAAAAPAAVLRPVVVVRQDGIAASSKFATAAADALAGLGMPPPTLVAVPADSARVHGLLAGYRGARLIGLVDHLAQFLIQEEARDCAAAVWCDGAHTDAGNGAASTHRLLTTPLAAGLGHGVAAGLRAADGGFVVCESLFGAPAAAPPASSRALPPSQGAWSAVLGTLYATVAAGAWRPGRPTGALHSGAAPSRTGESMASFIIESLERV